MRKMRMYGILLTMALEKKMHTMKQWCAYCNCTEKVMMDNLRAFFIEGLVDAKNGEYKLNHEGLKFVLDNFDYIIDNLSDKDKRIVERYDKNILYNKVYENYKVELYIKDLKYVR